MWRNELQCIPRSYLGEYSTLVSRVNTQLMILFALRMAYDEKIVKGNTSLKGSGTRNGINMIWVSIALEHDILFVAHTDLLSDAYRCKIGRIDDGNQPFHA